MLSAEEGKTIGAAMIGFMADQSKMSLWQSWSPGDTVDTSNAEGQLLAEAVKGVTLLLLGKVDYVPFVHATQGPMHICRVPAHDKIFVVTNAEGVLAAGLTNMLYTTVEIALNALSRGQIRPDEVRALPHRPDGIRANIDERSSWYGVGKTRFIVVLYDWRQIALVNLIHLYEKTAGGFIEINLSDDERTYLASLIELKRLAARAANA